jgi:type I restriction enzyme M protein
VDDGAKTLKELRAALDKQVREQYAKLTNNECLELLLERKWYSSLISGLFALYTSVSHSIASRNTELADRYEKTLPELEAEALELESKVKSHLKRMGFVL